VCWYTDTLPLLRTVRLSCKGPTPCKAREEDLASACGYTDTLPANSRVKPQGDAL